MIQIRPYMDEDYEAVKINLQDGDLFNESVDRRDILRQKIQLNQNSILVATIDGKVVGNVYIVYDPWNSFIFRLVVGKDFRNMGIGSKLMEESESLLKEKGVKDVALFVRLDDKELIDFYSKRGYVTMTTLHQCMYKEL